MENIDIFQIISQVRALIGTEDPKRERQDCPEMDHLVVTAEMMRQFMYLSMTVVAAGNTVLRSAVLYLLILELSIFEPLLLEARPQH